MVKMGAKFVLHIQYDCLQIDVGWLLNALEVSRSGPVIVLEAGGQVTCQELRTSYPLLFVSFVFTSDENPTFRFLFSHFLSILI